MKSATINSDREIRKRVDSIKRNWTRAERDARHVEAEKRQQRLAQILGLKLTATDSVTLHTAS